MLIGDKKRARELLRFYTIQVSIHKHSHTLLEYLLERVIISKICPMKMFLIIIVTSTMHNENIEKTVYLRN